MPKQNGNYQLEIGKMDNEAWSDVLTLFRDSNIYQSWAYGQVHWGKGKFLHGILREDNKIVSAAQIRVVRIPFIKSGIAYINWGPMWRRFGHKNNLDILNKMLSELVGEFSTKRRFYLRIFPYIYDTDDVAEETISLFNSLNFRHTERHLTTILLNITQPLEEMKSNFRRKWRQTLGYGLKEDLQVQIGTELSLIEKSLRLYSEMHQRKRFTEFVDMFEFIEIQRLLHDEMKLYTVLVSCKGEPAAAVVWANLGETILPVIAATNKSGYRTKASYVAWWKMLEKRNSSNHTWLDLGGINKQTNPGGYTFKTGIAGKTGTISKHIGNFDYSGSVLSNILFRSAAYSNEFRKKTKIYINRLINYIKT